MNEIDKIHVQDSIHRRSCYAMVLFVCFFYPFQIKMPKLCPFFNWIFSQNEYNETTNVCVCNSERARQMILFYRRQTKKIDADIAPASDLQIAIFLYN